MAQVSKTIRVLRPKQTLSVGAQHASLPQQQETVRRNTSDLAPARLFFPPLPQNSSTEKDGRTKSLPPLSKMPTSTLLRSLMIHYIMASPILRGPCMGVLRLAATSKLPIFNPEKNVLLGSVLYQTAYKQFCAGRNKAEVKQTIASLRSTGFNGVVLCYGREVVLDKSAQKVSDIKAVKYSAEDVEDVRQWREGLMNTLKCIGAGDILAIKFTGAGRIALDALRAGQAVPESIKEALDAVCEQAAQQGSRLWLDAEQTMLQKTIDIWTIDLMRKYNRNGTALVSNTIQSYLKSTAENVKHHLKLASEEGWTLGIKLVRGAYIESDPRELLHDTIEQTHECFDNTTQNLIQMKMPSDLRHLSFPSLQLFIATHNGDSVLKAQTAQKRRLRAGLPTLKSLEFGQLQGMADEVSYKLVQESEELSVAQHLQRPSKEERSTTVQAPSQPPAAAPLAFKYLTWGTLSECLGYLHRRAVENRGAIERTRHAAIALKRELFRRVTG